MQVGMKDREFARVVQIGQLGTTKLWGCLIVGGIGWDSFMVVTTCIFLIWASAFSFLQLGPTEPVLIGVSLKDAHIF